MLIRVTYIAHQHQKFSTGDFQLYIYYVYFQFDDQKKSNLFIEPPTPHTETHGTQPSCRIRDERGEVSEYLYLQLTLKHCIRSCMVIC